MEMDVGEMEPHRPSLGDLEGLAFEAIARTLPLGSVGYETEANERGERLIWLEGRDGGRHDGWDSTGATTLDSVIMASAKPPVKHMPMAPNAAAAAFGPQTSA